MRSTLRIRAGLALAAASLLSTSLHAQTFRVGAGAGMAYPSGRFSENAQAAPSFTVGVSAEVLPQFTVYGRYDATEFDWRPAGNAAGTARDAGFAVGASTTLATILSPRVPLSPWAGIGLVFHELEIEAVEEEIEERIGFDLQAGVELAPFSAVRIRPGVSYRQYRIDTGRFGLSIPGGYLPLAVEYVRAAVDVSIAF